MLPPGARVIVAVSGGADSVCLLQVLLELFPASVAGVAHFNHKWRPSASDEDERFVESLASRLDVPFFRAEAEPSQGNREQEARRARMKFFASLDATVALGHTRDDQAETVLFRFLRGSGLAGLAAIPPASNKTIRPLIDTTRAEIEQYLSDRRMAWREDYTNQDLTFARNRIRHELLPQLIREWNPNLTETLARLADLAHEEESYWTAHLVGQVPDLSPAELPASVLSLPRAVARRLIRQAIARAKGDLRRIDFDHVEAMFTLKRTLTLPGVNVTKSFDWLRFSPSADPIPPATQEITKPGTYPTPDGLSKICVELAQIGSETPPNACATLKVEACWFQSCPPLVLRGWRPGDHYRPAGHSRDHKVQEMFQKARVPSWRRASWPIISKGDRILWSRQFGAAQEMATGRDSALLHIWELI